MKKKKKGTQPVCRVPENFWMEKGILHAYTDGSTFRSNPGPMTWAVVYARDGAVETVNGKERIELGSSQSGTNMRAELMGIIWALEREPYEELIIMTDSLITMQCAIGQSRRRSNKDLWDSYTKALDVRMRRGVKTHFKHVKAHAKDPFNTYADELADAFAWKNFCLTIE